MVEISLPEGKYNSQFIIALSMALYLEKVQPAELTYFLEQGWSQFKIATELFNRVKPK